VKIEINEGQRRILLTLINILIKDCVHGTKRYGIDKLTNIYEIESKLKSCKASK